MGTKKLGQNQNGNCNHHAKEGQPPTKKKQNNDSISPQKVFMEEVLKIVNIRGLSSTSYGFHFLGGLDQGLREDQVGESLYSWVIVCNFAVAVLSDIRELCNI